MSISGIGQIPATVTISANTVKLTIEISIVYFMRYTVLIVLIITYLIPILPVPRHLGQVLKPVLSARVVGALGLAPKGSSRRTLPVPLQSGHSDIISIAAFRLMIWLDYIPFYLFGYTFNHCYVLFVINPLI